MNASDYLEKHWEKNAIWTHLLGVVHQERLKWCADRVVGNAFADVGCANGHSTSILKGFHSGEWTGVDFWVPAIDKAIQLFPDIKFIPLSSISDLKDIGKYDSVICSEVIEHVEDDQELVNMLNLMTNKMLVITTPCINIVDPGHLRLYTEDSLRKLFKDIGEPVIIKHGRFFFLCLQK